ncbi:hypothetical protein GA0115252_150021 [Streptomyces sp. DfronAA-171]|nr:hypothetical protein GA0115252_150021 [Streptomyces sp. DfronAA-171]
MTVAILPVARSLVSPSPHSGVFEARPSFSRSSQYAATFFEGALSMFSSQESPRVLYQRAPACQARPARSAGSPPPKLVIDTFGSALWIFSAAARYSSQVRGTSTPNFLKRSLR